MSDLDYNNTTSIGGQAIPGLRTRRVSSIVEMNEGQTLALAGLLQRDVTMKNTATPLLGDLPIVGAMFRNVSYTRSETELVILVTPKLASAMNPGQVPAAPGANWRYPNEAQLYGLGDLGGPTARTARSPRRTPRWSPRGMSGRMDSTNRAIRFRAKSRQPIARSSSTTGITVKAQGQGKEPCTSNSIVSSSMPTTPTARKWRGSSRRSA